MDQHKLGMCFLKHGDESEDDVTRDFMTFINITDVNFREICHPEILGMLRKEFENVNRKIFSAYRKSLSGCKFGILILSPYSVCLSSSLFSFSVQIIRWR